MSTFTRDALEESSSLLQSPDLCSILAFWALPRKGKKSASEVLGSRVHVPACVQVGWRKGSTKRPGAPEQWGEVSCCICAMDHVGASEPQQQVSKWLGMAIRAILEPRWLRDLIIDQDCIVLCLGFFEETSKAHPALLCFISALRVFRHLINTGCHCSLLAPVAWIFYHWKHLFRLSNKDGEENSTFTESLSHVYFLGG
jgi:hypothetical protein